MWTVTAIPHKIWRARGTDINLKFVLSAVTGVTKSSVSKKKKGRGKQAWESREATVCKLGTVKQRDAQKESSEDYRGSPQIFSHMLTNADITIYTENPVGSTKSC